MALPQILYLIPTLLALISCSDYHLIQKISLPVPINSTIKVTNMIKISDTKLGVILGTLSANESKPILLQVFEGTNFTNKSQDINITRSTSAPKFISDDILLNYGVNLSFSLRYTQHNIHTFRYPYLTGTMVVTGKYAYAPQQLGCAAVIRVTLATMGAQVVDIEKGTGCAIAKYTLMGDLGNGRLVLVANKILYFLNNETLKLQQKYEITDSSILRNYQSLDIYTDSTTKDTTLLLTRDDYYHTVTLDPNTKQYKLNQSGRFPSNWNLTLTGLDSGVSFQPGLTGGGGLMKRWRTLDDEPYAVDTSVGQSLLGKDVVGVSPREDQFLVYDQATKKATIYNISAKNNYKISLYVELTPKFNNLSDVQFYGSNYQNLLALNNQSFFFIKINNKNISYSAENPGNCSQLFLINHQNTKNAQVFLTGCYNQTSKYYFLQLRNISNLALIHRYPLNKTSYGLRILYNSLWNDTFIVLLKASSMTSSDNAYTMVLKLASNNTIINTSYIATNVHTFSMMEACSKFIIGFKFTYRTVNDITLWNYATLTEYKVYPYSEDSRYVSVLTSGNITIIEKYRSSSYDSYIDFYDMSDLKSPETWFQGTLPIRTYYQKQLVKKSTAVGYMILPNNGMYYLYARERVNSTYPYRVVYDVGNPPLEEIVPIRGIAGLREFSYFRAGGDAQQGESQCGGNLYFSDTVKWYKWVDCSPEAPISFKYSPTNPAYTKFNYTKFYMASTKKHLILCYLPTLSYRYEIEIRLLAALDTIIWSYRAEKSGYPGNQIYGVDFTNDNKIIINYNNSIDILDYLIQTPQTYNMSSFTLTDTNPLGNLIFAGPPTASPKKTRLIVKAQDNLPGPSSVTDLEGTVTRLALSANGTKIVAYDDKDIVRVYGVKGDYGLEVVWEGGETGVNDVWFVSETQLVIKKDNDFIIKEITNISTQIQTTPSSTHIPPTMNNSYRISISPDLQYLAITLNLTTTQILTLSNRQKILSFPIPNNTNSQTVSDLHFLTDNTLCIVSQTGVLYILSPTPCPDTYINVEGICLCGDNRTEISGKCVCGKNFVEEKGVCVCPEEFIFSNGKCVCRDNSTQVTQKCVCNKNFDAEGHECICHEPFKYNNLKCSCPQNTTQSGQKNCTCLKNFVPQNNTCICPDPFQFRDLQCLCKKNSTQSDSGQCICNHNFIPQNSTCICPPQFEFLNQQCLCRQNSTESPMGKCLCNHNFIPQDNTCICPSKYEFRSGECLCRYNSTQDEKGDCICNKNFVKYGESCVCPEEFWYDGRECRCRGNSTEIGGKCVCDRKFVPVGYDCVCGPEFDFDGITCQCKPNSTQSQDQCICNETFIKMGPTCQCPYSSTFSNSQCLCLGYIEALECKSCSWPCSGCEGPDSACQGYVASFYVVVVGSVVVGIAVLGVLGYCVRRRYWGRRERDAVEGVEQQLLTENNSVEPSHQ